MKFLKADNTRSLNGFSSIFLDALRLCCALIVVIGHCRQLLTPEWQKTFIVFQLGHGAVIMFFVLSGFVIAHTTSSKKRTIKTYFVSRLSRLYSIYIPALILTLVCAIAAFLINKEIYFQFDRGSNAIRYFLTLIFCNELWFPSTAPPMNGPFWSLSFEFWYYILFALIYFKWGSKKGMALIVIVCLFVGPKILSMFPIWGLGWLAYKMRTPRINVLTARIASFLFLLLSTVCMKYLPDYPGAVGYKPLYMANGFLSDTAAGFFAAVALWFLPTNTEAPVKDSALINRFRFCANLTYAVYLFHFPVLVVCSCILQYYHLSATANYFSGLVAVLILCFLLGSYFESKKSWWYHFFDKLLSGKKSFLKSDFNPKPFSVK